MQPHLHVIYCDDIRHEHGNKHSYMGVYSEQLLTTEYPVVLAKFCLALQLVLPSQPFPASLTLRVHYNAQLLLENTLNHNQLMTLLRHNGNQLNGQFNLVFAPFKLESPGTLHASISGKHFTVADPGLQIALTPTSPLH